MRPPARDRSAGRLTAAQRAWVERASYVPRIAARRVLRGGSRVPYDELISIGNEELVRAAMRYNPTIDVPFDGFAYKAVHFAMLKAQHAAKRLQGAQRWIDAAHLAGLDCGYEYLERVCAGDAGAEGAGPGDTGSAEESDGDAARRLEGLTDGLAATVFAGIAAAAMERRGEDAAIARLDYGRAMHALDDAVGSLSEHQELVRLRYFERLDWQDVARALGVAVATAVRDHQGAMRLLAARLKARGVDGAPLDESS
jgi:RNA polymerase sigma factor FliA